MFKIISLSILALSFSACAWNYVPPTKENTISPPPITVPAGKPADWFDGAYSITLNSIHYDIFINGDVMAFNSVTINNIEWRKISGNMYWAGTQVVPSDFYGIRSGLRVAVHINGTTFVGVATKVSSSN